MQFNSVFHPSDFRRREAVDDGLEDQLVCGVVVDIANGRGERRTTRFRLVLASDSNIGRSAGLSVVVAGHTHVFTRVGATQITDFQTCDADRVPVNDVFVIVDVFQNRQTVAEPFDFRLGTAEQTATQFDPGSLGHFHVS